MGCSSPRVGVEGNTVLDTGFRRQPRPAPPAPRPCTRHGTGGLALDHPPRIAEPNLQEWVSPGLPSEGRDAQGCPGTLGGTSLPVSLC